MSKKIKLEPDKVENMQTYFKKEHYEDSLLNDDELEEEALFGEDDLVIYQH